MVMMKLQVVEFEVKPLEDHTFKVEPQWNVALQVVVEGFRDRNVEKMSKVSYANAVGNLMYLMVCTRPDIMYAVSLVYGTARGNHVDVTSFVDLDYSKDLDKGRSIIGYGVHGCVVNWNATLQHVLGVELNIVAVNCDNQGGIHLSQNRVFHERTKHINVRYHFIKEVLEAKTVKVLKVGTEHNVVDALTKMVVEFEDLIDYHSTRDREQNSARGRFMYREDSNVYAFVVVEVKKIYAHDSLTFNDTGKQRRFLVALQVIVEGFRDRDVEKMSKVPYANAVGSLMYLMVCTRPDIMYAVSVVSRYLVNPDKNHWEAVKRILRYLRGTANVGLVYGTDRGNHVDVTSFVDLDYAKDLDKGRSIIGYEVHGCVVNWNATLQHVVALSTIEAEYMAFTKVIKEGGIHLSQNRVFHERTKHINARYHFIKEVLEAKTVKVLKVGTEHNVVDALTKMIPGHKL
ncbi:hypothetical protein Tco_0405613 [Tanacetum coccineum]